MPSKTLAQTKPMTQAMAVVIRKKHTVLTPTEPTFFMLSMDRMPSIMENKTTGTTMNLSRLTKMSPKGLSQLVVKSGPPSMNRQIRPTTIPSRSAMAICAGRLSFFFILGSPLKSFLFLPTAVWVATSIP